MGQAILAFLVCIVCTAMGAISGIGGGVIIKPLMEDLSNLSVTTISFLSGLTVEIMAVVSIARHYIVKETTFIESRRGTLLAVGSAGGGVVGKAIFASLRTAVDNDQMVSLCQNMVLLLLTVLVMVYCLCKNRIQRKNLQSSIVCLLIGLLLGVISSFLSIGGGPINLMVLSYCFHMDTKSAALHSLYIVLFSQTSSLITTFLSSTLPSFSWPTLIAMMSGGVLGAFIGRAFNRRLSSKGLDRLFLIVLVLIIGICLNNALSIVFSYSSIP